jgi:hypothetical protein
MAPRICLNCGDNRAADNSVLCDSCEEHIMMGGFRGDGR